MDHIDAEHGIRCLDRPARGGGVERDGAAQIGVSRGGDPRIDAGARAGVGVARLEFEPRQGTRKIRDMLTRAACQLKDEPACRQMPREHGKDGIAVALCRGRVAAAIGHDHTVAPSPWYRQPYPHRHILMGRSPCYLWPDGEPEEHQ
jgi:hypothetical protein